MHCMMKATLIFTLFTLLFSGCANQHGISVKYYSDCKEYYDYQGYYHKECGKDDVMTYKEMGDAFKKKEPEPTENVY